MTALHQQLTALYASTCSLETSKPPTKEVLLEGNAPTPPEGLDKTLYNKFLKEAEKAFKQVHDKGYTAADIKQFSSFVDSNYKVLADAINPVIAHVVPPAMLTSLNSDVYLFSQLRVHAQLYQASRLLSDGAGNLKSFDAFRRDIDGLHKNYNVNYLRAEYNYAGHVGEDIASWTEFVKDGDDYLLQYRTAQDDRVRDGHKAMAGLTLPVNDETWKTKAPRNGWGCRCRLIQVDRALEEETPQNEISKKTDAAISVRDKELFNYNPYFDKVVFPPKHPYGKVQGASSEIKKNGKYDFLKTIYVDKTIEEQYQEMYKSDAGGKVLAHELSGFSIKSMESDGDISEVLKTAIAFADEGYSVKIQPQIHESETKYRTLIYPKLESKKSNPDLYVNNSFYVDVKSIENIGKITKRANEAFEQGASVCITDLRTSIDEKDLDRYVGNVYSNKDKGEFTYTRDKVFFLIGGRLIPRGKPK
jgi:SPP1 gp7 family putative phage head morphogenesis protein